jgi:hypothetical protein
MPRRLLAIAVGLIFAALSAAEAQEALIIVRFVTAREGGPVPVDVRTTFETTDPMVVAWVQFVPSGQSHTVAFRWLDPRSTAQRISPTVLVTPGQSVLWDEMPIADASAEELPGTWTVELVVDERVLDTVRFSILPPPEALPPPLVVEYETTASTFSHQTAIGTGVFTHKLVNSLTQQVDLIKQFVSGAALTTSVSASNLWGTSSGTEGSATLSFDSGRGVFALGGVTGSWVTDFLQTPPLRLDSGSVFLDLQLSRPDRPSLAFSFQRDTEIDDRSPPETNSLTTAWTMSSAYSIGRLTLQATVGEQAFEDRTGITASFLARTATVSGAYTPNPRLFLFVTRTNLVQDFGATGFAPAFTVQTGTTTARLSYQFTPVLRGAVFAVTTDIDQSDPAFAFSSTMRGVEATVRIRPAVTLSALTQWQDQSTTSGLTTTPAQQRLSRVGFTWVPRSGMVASVFYSPQVTAAPTAETRGELYTASVAFFPSSRFSAVAVYTLNLTNGPALSIRNEVVDLSLRYAPTDAREFRLTARFDDLRNLLTPAADLRNTIYMLSVRFKY